VDLLDDERPALRAALAGDARDSKTVTDEPVAVFQ
jgi:hypothetical protein